MQQILWTSLYIYRQIDLYQSTDFDKNLVCNKHNEHQCQSCATGYNLKSGKCIKQATVCFCNNGEAKTDCSDDAQYNCESCSDGYAMTTTFECRLKVCNCENGPNPIGVSCRRPNDSSFCTRCHPGYHLNKYESFSVCRMNECLCDNGLGSFSDKCLNNGSRKCDSCDAGFELINDMCVEKVCICNNGVSVVANKCPKYGEIICIDCFEGFKLEISGEQNTVRSFVSD